MRLVQIAVIVLGGTLLGLAAFARTEGPSALTASPSTTTSSRVTVPETTTTTTPPRTTTTTEPPPSTTTTVPRGRLVIHGTGDVNTDTSYIPALAANGHAYAWEGLDGLFVDDDLTVINLECAPSDLGSPLAKAFVFRCDRDSLPVMAQAGVDVVSLANNHSADYGKEALVDGIGNVEQAGMAVVGVGGDAAEAAAPALIEVNGWTVAVVGFGGVVPTPDWIAGEDRPGMADGDTIETMVEAVEAAAAVADLVVVTIHWGVELDLEPRDDDRERAEAMIGAGANIIFGHHPHRLQPLEVVDGAPVAWSLGNFVWPNFSVPGSTTAVARVVVAPDGSMESCLIPAFISAPGRPELTADPEC